MKKRSRITSILLTLCMVLTLIPASGTAVSAAEEDDNSDVPVWSVVNVGTVSSVASTVITINDLDTPTAGLEADYSASVSSQGYTVTCVGYSIRNSKFSALRKPYTPKAGDKLNVKVYVSGDEFYKFAPGCSAVWNGMTSVSAVQGTDENSMCFTFEYDVPDIRTIIIPKADITIDAPVIGAKPDTDVTVKTAAVYAASVSWEPADDVFAAGKSYTAIVSLETESGFEFDSNPSVYVNGQAADIISGAGTQQMRVSCTFPELNEEAPVITSHPESVSAAQGDTVTFTAAAEGKNLHWQWWMSDSAGHQTKTGTDSSVLTIENVTSQYNNCDFRCVVSNENGEAVSSKAHLTVSVKLTRVEFKDVPKTAWYYKSVTGARDMGLINGTTEEKFSPDSNMTYAEAIKLAACMHQLYTDGSVTLKNGSPYWYSSYQDYCLENNIITKTYTDQEMRSYITREAYVDIFSRALPDEALKAVNNIPDGSIPDVKRTGEGSPYYDAIYKLYRAGVLSGSDAKGTFKPKSNIMRREVAAILLRMMNQSERVDAPAELTV